MIIFSNEIAFLGMGSFGTAIAHCLDKTNRYKISFYCRNEELVKNFNEAKSNVKSFPEYTFDNTIATSNIAQAVSKKSIIFITTPSNAIEEICHQIKDHIKSNTKIILCSKGISSDKPYFYSKIIKNILKKKVSIYIFSGPNFADEIISGDLSITTIAGEGIIKTKLISLLFRDTNIKIETTKDVNGVQIFGAMKNVMAITIGILEGLKCGRNRTIRTIMHFVKEIQKLNSHFGAKKNTAYLSAGIGDIMLTCFDDKSRNKKFGLEIAKGKSIENIIKDQLIEGYYAIKSIRIMSNNLKRIDKKNLFYINALYDILYNEKDPRILLDTVERKLEKENI